PATQPRRDRHGAVRQPVPLHRLHADHRRNRSSRAGDAELVMRCQSRNTLRFNVMDSLRTLWYCLMYQLHVFRFAARCKTKNVQQKEEKYRSAEGSKALIVPIAYLM